MELRNVWSAFIAYVTTPKLLIGASVFRIVAGSTILYQSLINYAQRHFLFGPDALYPYAAFLERRNGFSLFALSASPVYFEIAYHLGLVIAFLWLLGIRTRIMTPLTYLFWYSLHQRNQLLWDGGDNVMQLVMIFAMFADVSAHFSLDPWRRNARDFESQTPSTGRELKAIVHNGAMLAFALQICVVYAVAGLTKVQGESWRNGTALYYALRAAEFYLPNVSNRIYASDTFLALLCQMTVLFQVWFPCFIFFNKWTRRVALFMGITFHLAIGSVMGLVTFALFMMAVDLALVSDSEYRTLHGLLKRVTSFMERHTSSAVNRLRTNIAIPLRRLPVQK